MPNPELLSAIDLLLERRRTQEARHVLGPALQTNPESADLLVRFARAELIDDNDGEARVYLEAAVRSEPEHRFARYLLAALLCDAADYAQAESLLIGLLADAPTDADVLSLYSRTMLLSLHFDKAHRLAEAAVRNDPGNPAALRAVALVALVQGSKEERALAFQQIVAASPEDVDVARLLLYALVEEGRHREAFGLGQQLLRQKPDDNDLVNALVELRTLTHPAAFPCYPFVKWGWVGSIILWGGFVLLMPVLRERSPAFAGPVAVAYLSLVVYSWTYQPLLRRYLRWRGVS